MTLTEAETDALAELFNVGLHRAAASLSEVTRSFMSASALSDRTVRPAFCGGADDSMSMPSPYMARR